MARRKVVGPGKCGREKSRQAAWKYLVFACMHNCLDCTFIRILLFTFGESQCIPGKNVHYTSIWSGFHMLMSTVTIRG